MKYSMSRKINLGKYKMPYEAIDIGVVDCESREEAEKEIKEWEKDIIKSFIKPLKVENKKEEDIQVLTELQKKNESRKNEIPFN